MCKIVYSYLKLFKKMEANHKQFKPFDKVLVRNEYNDGNKWTVDLYSHYSDDHHVCVGMPLAKDNDILPYEGNEHLVGTTDEPEEEIKLEEGEWVMVSDENSLFPCNWELRYFGYTDETRFRAYYTELQIATRSSRTIKWKYAIRFSDFNPYDMEETKKHILYIKNGKVVRYKWRIKS